MLQRDRANAIETAQTAHLRLTERLTSVHDQAKSKRQTTSPTPLADFDAEDFLEEMCAGNSNKRLEELSPEQLTEVCETAEHQLRVRQEDGHLMLEQEVEVRFVHLGLEAADVEAGPLPSAQYHQFSSAASPRLGRQGFWDGGAADSLWRDSVRTRVQGRRALLGASA